MNEHEVDLVLYGTDYIEYVEAKIEIGEMPFTFDEWRIMEQELAKHSEESAD